MTEDKQPTSPAPAAEELNLHTAAGSPFKDISAGRRGRNAAARILIYLTMALALIPLVWVLAVVIKNGIGVIIQPEWWTTSQRGVSNMNPGGGAAHAIVGTFVQTAICSLISIPIGIFTAIYLVEYSRGGWLGRVTTFMVDILSGVPSIVAALFIFALWVSVLGQSKSGMAVALSLVLLMVPVIVRNTEEMLRVVPDDLREASYALGVPKWKTIVRIVLPTSLSGIITGVMLAIARVMGESAPVLILVGTSNIINWNPVNGPQASLPLMMLDMYKAGTAPAVLDKLWGAALTLVVIIAALNIAARFISAKFSVKS